MSSPARYPTSHRGTHLPGHDDPIRAMEAARKAHSRSEIPKSLAKAVPRLIRMKAGTTYRVLLAESLSPQTAIELARRPALHVTVASAFPVVVMALRKELADHPRIAVMDRGAQHLLLAATRGSEAAPNHSPESGLAPAIPYDVIVSNYFLSAHPPEEIVAWLRLMRRASRFGVVIGEYESGFWLDLRVALSRWLGDTSPSIPGNPSTAMETALPARDWNALLKEAGYSRVVLQRLPGRQLLIVAKS